jgi:hypothetical protein
MKALFERLRQRRLARRLERRAIPDDLWQLTVARLPFLARRTESDLAELRRLSSLFLDMKEFTGAGGLEVDDAMAVCIAAQACLPVLRYGLDPYRGFVGIVVQPDEVVARRSVTDEDGVVHEYDETLTGEAMEGGPVMLSWHDVHHSGDTAEWGYNVVIHEFAHVLDMGDGEADGVPPLPSRQARDDWIDVIDAEYERFCDAVDRGEDTVLDPYGATAVSEFFAVAVESFFVSPEATRAEHPELYQMLARYFRQDPAAG